MAPEALSHVWHRAVLSRRLGGCDGTIGKGSRVCGCIVVKWQGTRIWQYPLDSLDESGWMLWAVIFLSNSATMPRHTDTVLRFRPKHFSNISSVHCDYIGGLGANINKYDHERCADVPRAPCRGHAAMHAARVVPCTLHVEGAADSCLAMRSSWSCVFTFSWAPPTSLRSLQLLPLLFLLHPLCLSSLSPPFCPSLFLLCHSIFWRRSRVEVDDFITVEKNKSRARRKSVTLELWCTVEPIKFSKVEVQRLVFIEPKP